MNGSNSRLEKGEDVRSGVSELPQTPSNLIACPSLHKNSSASMSMENGGIQTSNKKPTIKDYMDLLVHWIKRFDLHENMRVEASLQGKEHPSCDPQDTIAKLYTWQFLMN